EALVGRRRPEIGGHAVVLQEFVAGLPGGEVSRAREEDGGAVLPALGRFLEPVQTFEDALLHPFGAWGLAVVLVVEGQVVVDVLGLVAVHPPDPVFDDGADLVGEGGVVGLAHGDGGSQYQTVAVLMLQTLALEGGAPGSATEQEASGTGVGRGP